MTNGTINDLIPDDAWNIYVGSQGTTEFMENSDDETIADAVANYLLSTSNCLGLDSNERHQLADLLVTKISNDIVYRLREEAAYLYPDVVIAYDDETIQLRPEGGEDSSGDVIIDLTGKLPVASECGGCSWEFSGTIANYLSERDRTGNWA